MDVVLLFFTICLSGGAACESHEVAVPGVSLMQCMVAGQARIPRIYPVREGQEVTSYDCRLDG